jgi:hypothetical protein
MRNRNRKRACRGCARAKARCDQALPACGRCSVRSLSCEYNVDATNQTEPEQEHEHEHEHTEQAQTIHLKELELDTDANDDEYGQDDHLNEVFQVPPAGGAEEFVWAADPAATTMPATELKFHLCLALSPCIPEHELLSIDEVFVRHFDFLAGGIERLAFIHFQHLQPLHRSPALETLAGITQLFSARTAESESAVLDLISYEVYRLFENRQTYHSSQNLAAFQSMVLYSAMRVYSTSVYVNDMIDTTAATFSQFVLRQNLHLLQPATNVQPSDWSQWITDESTRRTFFATHALNVVSNARKGFSTNLCGAFPEVPLPLPTHIWEATTADSWAFHHRAWERHCGEGGALRGKDVLDWVDGREVPARGGRRRECLFSWFTTIGALGEVILLCARAQLTAATAIIRPIA